MNHQLLRIVTMNVFDYFFHLLVEQIKLFTQELTGRFTILDRVQIGIGRR